MPKLYYITRTFPPFSNSGGAMMREAAVTHLRGVGWDVTVIVPDYNCRAIDDKAGMIRVPFPWKVRTLVWLERLGIFEDYLDLWVERAYQYLEDRVKRKDIVFATAGGELGTIKLAVKLKKKLGCKIVANFRDPTNYTLVNNMKLDKKFHVNREKSEKKLLEPVDLIVTSSIAYQKALSNKYPIFSRKIKNNYFGYISTYGGSFCKDNRPDDTLNIIYAGNFGRKQSPELLISIVEKMRHYKQVKLYFIGNYKQNKKLTRHSEISVEYIGFMPREALMEFMASKVDMGFVSLVDDYLGACVPSKIYEYINVGLPILGALPDGDAKAMIHNRYGEVYHYRDIDTLAASLDRLVEQRQILDSYRQTLLDEREQWSMEKKVQELNQHLIRLLK